MIKKKDGSEYSIRKPPNLSKFQSFWKKEDVVLHNFNFKKSIISKEEKEEVVKVQKVVEIKEEKKVEKVEKKPEKSEIKSSKKTNLNKLVFHCLPTIVKTVSDDFYGEQYSKTVYDNKIKFEGLFIDSNGLEMSFWTNVKLNPGSVVYPSRYSNGEPLIEYQWWKVVSSEEKHNGFIYLSIVSDYQPDFS